MSTTKRKAKTKAKPKAKTHITKKRVPAVRKVHEKPAEAPVEEKKVILQEKSFLLAVRLIGSFGTPAPVETTLTSLNLKRKFNAVLLEEAPSERAMLRDAKDYLTWGEIGSKDIAVLLRERGELVGGISVTDKSVQDTFGKGSIDELALALAQGNVSLKTLKEKGLRPVFRLRPPSDGFVGSIKRPFGSRGELGHRGHEISSLVARMV